MNRRVSNEVFVPVQCSDVLNAYLGFRNVQTMEHIYFNDWFNEQQENGVNNIYCWSCPFQVLTGFWNHRRVFKCRNVIFYYTLIWSNIKEQLMQLWDILTQYDDFTDIQCKHSYLRGHLLHKNITIASSLSFESQTKLPIESLHRSRWRKENNSNTDGLENFKPWIIRNDLWDKTETLTSVNSNWHIRGQITCQTNCIPWGGTDSEEFSFHDSLKFVADVLNVRFCLTEW